MRRIILLLVSVGAFAIGACSGSQDVTSPSSAATTGSYEVFEGALAPGGSSAYSFTLSASTPMSISLASLMADRIGPASPAVTRLSLGVSSGTDCSITKSVDTAAGLTAELNATLDPNTYCVTLADIGSLFTPMNFAARIGHNIAASTANATAVNETFASSLSPRGASAHSFSVTQPGMINVTLSTLDPSLTVGLGIGIPGVTAPTCSLSTSVDATSGSQLTTTVDPGIYCVELFDTGAVTTQPATFSLTIAHP